MDIFLLENFKFWLTWKFLSVNSRDFKTVYSKKKSITFKISVFKQQQKSY